MKLFEDFEAVKFPQENMILITRMEYLYYIYRCRYKRWSRHKNAGNDYITVANYDDVSREELMAAMNGVFPQSERDFMRLCGTHQLSIGNMMALLEEDYTNRMADYTVYHRIHRLLLESDIPYKSFEKLRELLDVAAAKQYNHQQVAAQIGEASFQILGRNIFKREIGIVDGHNGFSYFWIMPVRVIDDSDTNAPDNVAEMRAVEISIEEDDVEQYLTPFLYRYYEDDLEANQWRIDSRWIDEEGNEQTEVVCGFEWYLTHNFFTFGAVEMMLRDIADTVDALASGRETEYTEKLKAKRGAGADNADGTVGGNETTALVIDFYQRFLYRMEHMLKVGKEKGYNLISFMVP